MAITYAREQNLSPADYVRVIASTYMGEKRPIANAARIDAMLRGSNLVVTAREEDGSIVGLVRGMGDGAWVCYVADVAVHSGHQGKGIGKAMLDECTRILGPKIGIVLVAYPEAEEFYRRIGLGEMRAFYVDRGDSA
jgi:ribosomal protein S18 acetylase RimI-like enzyme